MAKVACGVVILLAAWLLLVQPAHAQAPPSPTFTLMGPTFPHSMRGTVAVWAGSSAYVFGGMMSSDAFRYDPAVNSLAAIAPLPYDFEDMAGAWDGAGTIYLAGGVGFGMGPNCNLPWGGPG
ncbi:MAG: hypothetical protein LC620_07350, partial [Halobacteriales archaeon]|nr:hypothetical protein [Halobacteriales archaeon]